MGEYVRIEKSIRGWWLGGMELRDGRKIVVGETHSVKPPIILCKHGLHLSKNPLVALEYGHGNRFYRVEATGEIQADSKKMATEHRRYLWYVDAEPLLWRFARMCALDVIQLWEAPPVVVRYLKTGDESIRAAAGAAARDAAWAAARTAAWPAARVAAWATARDAARDAVWDAVWDAARAAVRDAARAAAGAAVWDAARAKQRRRLIAMLGAATRHTEGRDDED